MMKIRVLILSIAIIVVNIFALASKPSVLSSEEFMSLLAEGNYQPGKHTASFDLSDIEMLMEFASKNDTIQRAPNNPLSSFLPQGYIIGVVSMWFIEGIRQFGEFSVSTKNFSDYPSQNPVLMTKAYKVEGLKYDPLNASYHETALNAYRQWYNIYMTKGFEFAKNVNPLEATNLRWK